MTSTDPDRPQVIAFYLPQFHPIPENDAWWGRGFTEWRNVVPAQPLFDGHHQPHLPSDLGFYDLRVPEVREQQAALARAHGIDAFCYYHYWFGGKRVLDRVFDEVRATGTPDHPFCLCWVNENWTRAWDAGEHEILLEQTYDADEQDRHLDYLVDAFGDPRYVRVDGRPLFMLYRAQSLPDAPGFVDQLRARAVDAGVGDPLVVKFDTHQNFDDPAPFHCDAAAQFVPHGMSERVTPVEIPGLGPGNEAYPYEGVAAAFLDDPDPGWTRFRCVAPGWDNTARRGDGRSILVTGNTPERYEAWLRAACERAGPGGVVFVNAWNEWAEGAHLEPDQRNGRAYLRATARAVLGHEPAEDPLDGPQPVLTGPRFADLYVDLYERHVRLQRRLTAVESLLQRRLASDPGDLRVAEAAAVVDRLTDRIAELEARLAELDPRG